MRRESLLAGLSVAALLLGGCVPEATPVQEPTVTPGDETSAAPPLTPEPMGGTRTPLTAAACLVPPGNPAAPDLDEPGGVLESVLGYLNRGGSLASLAAHLKSAGFTSGRGDPILTLDLNGDSRLDLVIAVLEPVGPRAARRGPAAALRPALQSATRGSLIVLLCQLEQYVAGAIISAEPTDGLPVLHAGRELTDDSSGDLLLGWETCGAHTCFQRFEVLSLLHAQLRRLPLDPSDDLPYPEVNHAAGGTVEITATGIGSVGAGPFRRLTRSWDWDPAGQVFRLVSEQVEPPRYRIHVALDADAAALAGDLRQALNLYHRVALDGSLLDWVDPATEQANLIGYAMFRVVLTYLQMNDEGDAQKAYGILQNQYPSGAVGHAYARMAQVLWEAYGATGELAQGCQAARAFAEVHADEVVTPLYFGYANRTLAPADLCPSEPA